MNYAALVESVQGGYKLSAERSRVALSKSRVGLTLDVGKEVTTGNILEDQTIKRLSLKRTRKSVEDKVIHTFRGQSKIKILQLKQRGFPNTRSQEQRF